MLYTKALESILLLLYKIVYTGLMFASVEGSHYLETPGNSRAF